MLHMAVLRRKCLAEPHSALGMHQVYCVTWNASQCNASLTQLPAAVSCVVWARHLVQCSCPVSCPNADHHTACTPDSPE